MSKSPDPSTPPPIVAALCIDGASIERFGSVLRRLTVGLVDQAIQVRVVSTDPRVEALSFGPVRAQVRPLIRWPLRKRRLEELAESLSQPPQTTIVHALAYESYEVAFELARLLEADLVIQVTSVADCDELLEFDAPSVPRFLVSSEALATMLEKQCNIVREAITLVRPGILIEEQAACFANDKRAPTIVCTSPFERGSGVDILIEAIHLLRQRGISLITFLMGQGSIESDLRRRVHERNLSACVVFARPLGGHEAALHHADMFVRPSADAAFSIEVLQAMAAGLVVVTFATDICDYVRDGETSVVCDARTPEAMARAIEVLIQDRASARRIATSAMAYLKTRHSISTMAERTAEAYRELALRRSTFSLRR